MHKKIIIIICISVFVIGAISWFLFKDNRDFFLQRIDSIENVTLLTETGAILLPKEETHMLKEIVENDYKRGHFSEEKLGDFGLIPFLFKTNVFNEQLSIFYYPQKKQLVFNSYWLIPINLSKDKLGKYVFKTNDLIFTIDNEETNLLEDITQNIY